MGEQAIAPDLGAAEEQNVFGRQVTFNIGCDRRGFSAAMSALLNTPFVSLLAVRALVTLLVVSVFVACFVFLTLAILGDCRFLPDLGKREPRPAESEHGGNRRGNAYPDATHGPHPRTHSGSFRRRMQPIVPRVRRLAPPLICKNGMGESRKAALYVTSDKIGFP